ncbi:DUF2799 domain-containing protein [Yanghanlia caeni]|uniref:DUF2799 domain-containing protein n=1 Tax=Yanghanlia caeni TaxID=3064283 RepID=A0ABU1D803_9BURK|nr:DUF2799 domain-containing protein [Alcaligenaceae bacterium LG-2]
MLTSWKWRLRPCLYVSVALLTGCASMSEEECLTADWYERGVLDGRRGEPGNYVHEHHEACAKVGVTPDNEAWQRGRSVGIRYFCTPENGERVGLEGRAYRHTCPPELEAPFLQRYRPAYRVYEAEQRVRNLSNDINNKERQLDREKDEDKRRRIRRELRDLDDRLRRARHDLYHAERQLYRQ